MYDANLPIEAEVKIAQIPPNCTSLIQPLDCQFFRTYKSYVRRITERIALDFSDFDIRTRDQIFKLQVWST